MHPMNPTLTEMVVAVTIESKRAAVIPIDPGELERYAYRILRRFEAERPKVTAYLPDLAVKAILALLHERPLPVWRERPARLA